MAFDRLYFFSFKFQEDCPSHTNYSVFVVTAETHIHYLIQSFVNGIYPWDKQKTRWRFVGKANIIN